MSGPSGRLDQAQVMEASTVEPPIIVVEGMEIYVLGLGPAGTVSLEPQDIEGGRSEAFDRLGDLLDLFVGTAHWQSRFLGFTREHSGPAVFVRLHQPRENRAGRLASALRTYLRHMSKLTPEQLSALDLPGLVREATKAMPKGNPL